MKLVIGKRGRGKTTLVKQYIKESRAKRIWIFDFVGEYQEFQDWENVFIQRADLYDFCFNVWKFSSKENPSLVIFDEIASYGKNSKEIEFLFRLGRHKGIEICCVAHRLFDLPPIVRSQADQMVLFQITLEMDLKELVKYVNKPIIDTLIYLPKFKYIIVDFEKI